LNNRDLQIVDKILKEIEVIEDLLIGFDLESFSSDERTKEQCV